MFGFAIPEKLKRLFGARSEDDGLLTSSVDFSSAGETSNEGCDRGSGGESSDVGSCDSGGGDGGSGD